MTRRMRCEIIPLSGHQVSFRIDDREVLRWNSGTDFPRPYFFPVTGPSGRYLTRMGHPGAPDHDHHQSLWFAHHQVLGIDFWGNHSTAAVRQKQWLAYDDGDAECRMAVELEWFDGHNPEPLLNQQLICEVAPSAGPGEFTIELQSRFVPASASLEFGQTNFGFLAIRMSKSISAHFGSGVLTGSSGIRGESALFEQPSQWMDYSGPTDREGQQPEGVTFLDHPSNPGQPTRWHVRDDGWMCASPCMRSPLVTSAESPLSLRYRLLCHAGGADPERANREYERFASLPQLELAAGPRPHTRWKVSRVSAL